MGVKVGQADFFPGITLLLFIRNTVDEVPNIHWHPFCQEITLGFGDASVQVLPVS